MRRHYATESEACESVENYICAWELLAALQDGPNEFKPVFDEAEIEDRDPTPGVKHVNVAPIRFKFSLGEANVHVSKGIFPQPPRNRMAFNRHVDLMFKRYVGYRAHREPLTGMANFCLTVLENSVQSTKKNPRYWQWLLHLAKCELRHRSDHKMSNQDVIILDTIKSLGQEDLHTLVDAITSGEVRIPPSIDRVLLKKGREHYRRSLSDHERKSLRFDLKKMIQSAKLDIKDKYSDAKDDYFEMNYGDASIKSSGPGNTITAVIVGGGLVIAGYLLSKSRD